MLWCISRWKRKKVSSGSDFNIIEKWDIIEASFQQDYNITMTKQWLESTSARRFMVLLKGLTKYTALGTYLINKELKDSNINNHNGKKKSTSFNPQDKHSWKMFGMWAKGFKKK